MACTGKAGPWCCCRNYYMVGTVVRLREFGVLDGARFRRRANDSSISTFAWTLDHKSQQIFSMGWPNLVTNAHKIGKMSMKIPLLFADNVVTEILDYGSSFSAGRLCTDPDNEHVYYVLKDASSSDTLYFRRCDFDGSNDTSLFTRTGRDTSELPGRVEYCRNDGRLYYKLGKSGDSYQKIYRCDTNGSNDALVYDSGASNYTLGGSGNRASFTIDNVRGKLYASPRYTASPFYGDILRMDLDGTNQETIYNTGTYTSPQSAYGVYVICYSHKDNSIYWVEGSGRTEVLGNADEPTGGLWKAGFDGSSPTQLCGGFEFGSEGTSPSTTTMLDLGCGFETLGEATLA